MKKTILLTCTLVSLLLFAFLAFKREAAAADLVEPPCTVGSQAGKIDVMIPKGETSQMVAVSFSTDFCEAPVLVATGGENTRSVQIGVVTEQAAWLIVEGQQSGQLTVYWQAIEPTQ